MSDDNQWHLDKKINITHMLTTAGMIAAAFLWASDVEQRIGQNAQEIKHTKEIQEIQNDAHQKSTEKVEKQLNRIDQKLDKLIERELNGHGQN